MLNSVRAIKWKKALGWSLYDIGTSGYFLVFPLYLFPVYLSQRIFAAKERFELSWGIAQGIAIVTAVTLGLLLGKHFDRKGLRQIAPRVVILAACSCLLLPLLVALKPGPFLLLSGYVIVHGLHLLSLTIYDASLTHITDVGAERAVISGWAWGCGYVGGLLCMGVMELGLFFYPRYSAWDFFTGTLYYLIVALFAARWLRKSLNAYSEPEDTISNESQAHRAEVRWVLLIGMMLMVDGIAVFMSYTGLFGTRVLHLPERQMTSMLGLLQLLAFPMTGIVATAGRKNVPKALLLCSAGWMLTVVLLVNSTSIVGMVVTIVTVSVVVGTTQALLRSLYADQILARHAAAGFGRYALVEKGAAFLGPVIAGSLIPFVGYRAVLMCSGFSILLGGFIVWWLTRNRHSPD